MSSEVRGQIDITDYDVPFTMPHPITGQLDRSLCDENLWPSHLERYIASTCEPSDLILVSAVWSLVRWVSNWS